MSDPLRSRVLRAFRDSFGVAPTHLVRAPGRVNLIGEHTDYNDGFVLPLAIDRAVWIALRERADDTVKVRSLDFDEIRTFPIDGLAGRQSRTDPVTWVEYVRGSLWALARSGAEVRGWEGVVAGDVPVGAGLSSSAALEIATLRAMTAVTADGWSAPEMARLGQVAENRWVGMNCGIMDQMISAAGRAGHALLIDCRSLETRPVALPADTVVVVMDTATRRGLVDSEYNERRASCEAAAAALGAAALRDVTIAEFRRRENELDPVVRKRARHVVTENDRTVEAAHTPDAVRLGELMNASHASLRDDFEVSTDELDRIVRLARDEAGCLGARMTGAGFGGCAVALVRAAAAPEFMERVGLRYAEATGLTPGLFATPAADGATIEPTDDPS